MGSGRRSRISGEPGLQLALAAAGPGAAVLEPVEDVGVADGAEFFEELADPHGLILGGVHHAAVEDGFEDEDLLGLGGPTGTHGLGGGAAARAVVVGGGVVVAVWGVVIHG